MPDVEVTCAACKGARFNSETLEVTLNGKTIDDVLNMPIEEGVAFFAKEPAVGKKIEVLADLGLGYLTLGQSATTLSGGEAQRIKLAYELGKESHGKTLYVLDEPTTGLHFTDVEKLIHILHRLVEMGNTVVTIEHNLDIVKDADYLIDLGPEGGEQGGYVVACGSPLEVANDGKQSYTARFLREYLNGGPARLARDVTPAHHEEVA
jgi:excinuclease ABC subunit A